MTTEPMSGPHADPPKSRGEEWNRELHPNDRAGLNDGSDVSARGKGMGTAYDVKQIHRALSGIADDDLKQIPVLPEGERLRQGATYIDLLSDSPEEFTAMGGMVAGEGHLYIPKDEVPYTLWILLIGEPKPGNPRA